MAITPSFTPQEVINTARLRHPGLTTLVLDDPALVDDYNQVTRAIMVAAVRTKAEALMEQTATVAVAGADGGVLPLEFPEGELVGIPTAIEATQSAVLVRVLLRTNIEQREAMARELIDDGRPGGIILRDRVNNQWELKEIINWAGVTAISAYGTFFPVEVLVATLTTEVLLPFVFFGPLVEAMALQLSHRADLNAEWMTLQTSIIQQELEIALTMLGL